MINLVWFSALLNPQKATGWRRSEGGSEAEEPNVPKLLFRFGKQAASLAQKCCAASPTAVSDPTGHGFPGWKHVTLHFLRVHMDATYREIVDWASEMDRVRGLLQLARTTFPAPQRCTGRLRGCPCRCGAASFGSPRTSAIRARMGPSMPRSSTAKRHRDITNTARIATYARSKRRHSSIQTRVPSSISTARHTGLTTPRLAVESPFVTPRK